MTTQAAAEGEREWHTHNSVSTAVMSKGPCEINGKLLNPHDDSSVSCAEYVLKKWLVN